jgi:hypothetical protein
MLTCRSRDKSVHIMTKAGAAGHLGSLFWIPCRRKNFIWSQMKHQLDATLCRFYFCRVTLHVSCSVPALIRRCNDLPATITHVPVATVLILNTPDDGRLRPKHVEWLCRNKTCTVLYQVGVSFDLYYDARKHKIEILSHLRSADTRTGCNGVFNGDATAQAWQHIPIWSRLRMNRDEPPPSHMASWHAQRL